MLGVYIVSFILEIFTLNFPVMASIQKSDKSLIPQKLQLLPDFCLNIVVPGMFVEKFRFKSVDLIQCKKFLVNGIYTG